MRVKSLTPPLPSVLPMTAITSSAVNCRAARHASSPDASCTLLSSTLATSTDIALSTLEHVWSIHKCAGHSLRFPRRRGHPYIQVVGGIMHEKNSPLSKNPEILPDPAAIAAEMATYHVA